jgi:catechol 2,3-dioxygenase-like lactoylglutathione lyase family enzyme
MPLRHLTLRCEDVAAGATFFREVLALPVRQRDGRRVDVEMGPLTATLTAWDDVAGRPSPADTAAGSPAAVDGAPPAEAGPSGPAVIVELEVEDVRAAVGELRRRGARVLVEPVTTDYGTDSAFIAGPAGVIVELYRLHAPPRPPWLDDATPR